MPEIVFKGKEYVCNHHLTVPYRPLVAHPDKGIGPPDLGGNLIIHGDNLAALKSLLPRYAGQVDLIFIDPPYNTGNEGWCYSDNVNSPIMREWLSSNPVEGEDLLRHDKWLCMMWPRLTLLRELLSERGSIWMTLDDNEVHRARMVRDELFGDAQTPGVDLASAYDDLRATVVALEITRTFWQKATILHAEHHRPPDLPIRDRFVRHCADFEALWRHPRRADALARLDLLADLVRHKSRFFSSGWTHYETAKPGTSRLVPPPARQAAPARDYATMAPMLIGTPIEFNVMSQRLQAAERDLNDG